MTLRDGPPQAPGLLRERGDTALRKLRASSGSGGGHGPPQAPGLLRERKGYGPPQAPGLLNICGLAAIVTNKTVVNVPKECSLRCERSEPRRVWQLVSPGPCAPRTSGSRGRASLAPYGPAILWFFGSGSRGYALRLIRGSGNRRTMCRMCRMASGTLVITAHGPTSCPLNERPDHALLAAAALPGDGRVDPR